jgi:hypothetical protein
MPALRRLGAHFGTATGAPGSAPAFRERCNSVDADPEIGAPFATGEFGGSAEMRTTTPGLKIFIS